MGDIYKILNKVASERDVRQSPWVYGLLLRCQSKGQIFLKFDIEDPPKIRRKMQSIMTLGLRNAISGLLDASHKPLHKLLTLCMKDVIKLQLNLWLVQLGHKLLIYYSQLHVSA